MDDSGFGLYLLNGPYVVIDGDRRAVPEGSKRLLVLLAIRHCISRRAPAELLWPAVEPRRGQRAICGRRHGGYDAPGSSSLPTKGGMLRLDARAQVDVDILCRRAHRLAAGTCHTDDLEMLPSAVHALDLLPGWYEDWVSIERERVRTVMLDAIDAIAVRLRQSARCVEAIDTALVAVTTDPLRDCSQSALITAHLGEAISARLAVLSPLIAGCSGPNSGLSPRATGPTRAGPGFAPRTAAVARGESWTDPPT